jgi:hypothetical protein
VHLALSVEKFEGDIVEGGIGFVAGDVSEMAGGVAELAVGHHQVDFRFVLDGVYDVGGTEGHVEIGHIVLMEKSGFVGGDVYPENADVGIFKDEMVVRLLRDRNGDRRLGVHGKCKKHQR